METGDLLFTQTGSDENMISAVTEGFRGARPDHMGVVVQTDLGLYVLEAYPPEVRLNPLSVFLTNSSYNNSGPRYLAGRLIEEFRYFIPAAIEYGIERRNTPYDRLFMPDAKELYCSELVVDMFFHANGNKTFFVEEPMSFRDLKSGLIHPHWVNYYRGYGLNVPDGEPGSNPGDISLDKKIEIYDVVGPLVGLRDA